MTSSWLRRLAAASFALALAQMPACSTPSPADPPTFPCTRETVLGGVQKVPASGQIVQTFTTQATGRLHVTVDWPSPETIIRVVLAQTPCGPDQFRVNGCNVISDLFPPPKPVEESTTWLRPGNYDLILANFSTVEETTAVKVVLSSAGCETP